jgi:hypothetical protein
LGTILGFKAKKIKIRVPTNPVDFSVVEKKFPSCNETLILFTHFFNRFIVALHVIAMHYLSTLCHMSSADTIDRRFTCAPRKKQ